MSRRFFYYFRGGGLSLMSIECTLVTNKYLETTPYFLEIKKASLRIVQFQLRSIDDISSNFHDIFWGIFIKVAPYTWEIYYAK